jgi:hypothetical protein
MKVLGVLCLFGAAIAPAAELKSGPPMPYTVVADWPKLPQGWTFGPCSTVTVDKQDHVWIFSRGAHPVTEFDRDGKLLRAWGEGAVQQAHGIRIDADGNVWGVDVTGAGGAQVYPGRTRADGGGPGRQARQ